MTKTLLLSLITLTTLIASGCATDSKENYSDKKVTESSESGNNISGGIIFLDCDQLPEDKKIPAPAAGANCVQGLADMSKKPFIPSSNRPAPKQLITEDVVSGIGTKIKKGDRISVQYVGTVWGENKEFDSSWEKGSSFEFTVGNNEVIKGWDKGLIGAKEGSRRVLIIPPSLSYGAAGSPPVIPGNATLVFIVDVEKIDRPVLV